MEQESESEGHLVVFDSATPWTIQSMEFSRPEYWSGEPFPSLGIFPTQGSNPGLLHCRRILYQLYPKGSPRCLADAWISHFPLGVEERPHFWSDSLFSPSLHPQMLVNSLRFKAQPCPLGTQCWMRQSWSLPSRLPSMGREVKNSHRKCGIQYIITNCEKGNGRKD